MLVDDSQKNPRERALDTYFRLAQTTVLGRLHQQLRVRHHQHRYGLRSEFMFRPVEMEINSIEQHRSLLHRRLLDAGAVS